MMAAETIHEKAQEEAELIAPKPKHEPVEAGLAGMFVCGIVVAVFSAFAGLDTERLSTATAWTCAVGLAASYFFYRNLQTKHYRAYARAYQSYKGEADARRT